MNKTMPKQTSRRFKDYLADKKGIATIVFALMIPVLIASAGVGVDLALAYNAKNRLSDALDKAVLAAGSSTTLSTADLQTRFTDFFNANYPSGEHYGTPYNVQLTVDGNTLTATASVKVPTTFMSLFGIKTLNVNDTSQAILSLAGVEAVLVLDVTGSMGVPQCGGCGTNMDSLKTASTDFLNIMFSKITDPAYLKIGIVPWNDTVNVGSYGIGENPDGSYYGTPFVSPPATDDYITPSSDITYDSTETQTNEWWGCVVESDPSNITQDSPPTDWVMYRYPSGSCLQNWCNTCSHSSGSRWHRTTTTYSPANGICNSGDSCSDQNSSVCVQWQYAPNDYCPTSPIMPLTNDQTALQNEINNLPTLGNTYPDVGMVWGWRVISNAVPFTEGVPYSNTQWSKTVIMMTDGNATVNSELSGEGAHDTAGVSTSANDINNKFEQICTNMKAAGIRIYTITFQSAIQQSTKDYYSQCATTPNMYYDAPTNADLINAFNDIATQLSQLHLSE